MMPKLQNLELSFYFEEYLPFAIKEKKASLVREAAIVAVSQEKNLVIKSMYRATNYPNLLKMTKKDEDFSDTAIPTLNFMIDSVQIDKVFIANMKYFARKNLPREWVLTYEYDYDLDSE